ncbi:MAG: hypothetical protein ACLR8Y_03685 [Alistipes indistinctus]
MHTAKRCSVGLRRCGSTDLPSLKARAPYGRSVGFLRTAKHVIKDGKDQMPLPYKKVTRTRELFEFGTGYQQYQVQAR